MNGGPRHPASSHKRRPLLSGMRKHFYWLRLSWFPHLTAPLRIKGRTPTATGGTGEILISDLPSQIFAENIPGPPSGPSVSTSLTRFHPLNPACRVAREGTRSGPPTAGNDRGPEVTGRRARTEVCSGNEVEAEGPLGLTAGNSYGHFLRCYSLVYMS